MPETFNLNQTQIQLLRNEPRVLEVLLLSRAVPNISPQTLASSLTLPGDSEPSASSPTISCSPPTDPSSSECASYFCTAVILSPHPSQHMQTHVYTLVHTHSHTCMHTHICTCTNMHTHLSKPPFKSQLKCQKTQESLCLGLGQISLLYALPTLLGCPLQH